MQGDRQGRDFPGQIVGAVAGAGRACLADRTGDLRDQIGLAIGGGTEGAQVAGFHAVFGQRSGALGDHHRVLVEEAARTRGDDPGLAQCGNQVLADAGPFQQILAAQPNRRRLGGHAVADQLGLVTDRDQPGGRIRRVLTRNLTVGLAVELGLDDLQWQVVVALGGQDEPEPRTVIGGEPAVPRGAALRGNQTLGLEKPNLGDGDVGEIRPQQIQHGSDRHPGRFGTIGGAH